MSVRRSAFALAVAAALAASADAGWWEQASRAKETSLETVVGAPSDWRDVTATFVVRFQGATAATSDRDAFPSAEWRAFTAASRDGKTSHELLVRRGSAEDARLAKLTAGDDVRVRAVLRRAGGAAAIEVVWLGGPADGLSPEEAADLARADELLIADSGEAAETLCRRILESRDLGAPLRADLWRRIARAARSQGRLADAADAWRKVLFLAPDDAVASGDLARIETALAGRPSADASPATAAAPAASDPMARAARPLPKSPAASVPAPVVRLAPPRDRDTPVVPPLVPALVPAPAPPSARDAAAAPTPPAAPPRAPENEPPPPPRRLAQPK